MRLAWRLRFSSEHRCMSRTKEEPGMVASTQFQTQRVGALPVIARFCQRLQLGSTVDRLVPWEGEVPLGDLVEILVANRLLEPKALYRLGSWATQATLADSYNLTEQQLHDDRIGRALERVADHGDAARLPWCCGPSRSSASMSARSTTTCPPSSSTATTRRTR